MENKISVHNLKKNFGKLEVLKDISIEIREGEVVCMIGPSGSGKSTFLRCLNRLEKITSGHVVVDGHPISEHRNGVPAFQPVPPSYGEGEHYLSSHGIKAHGKRGSRQKGS